MFRRKKNRDEITNIELTEGMMICPEYQGSENRMKTLLLKGVLVYLLVMGVMGSYLSALDIRFSWVALHVVIFLCTVPLFITVNYGRISVICCCWGRWQ